MPFHQYRPFVTDATMEDVKTALVLSAGGMFGAYQAGVWQALSPVFRPDMVIGCSVGSINGALIAGSAPERRLDALRGYWLGHSPLSPATTMSAAADPLRHAANWMSAMQARLFGATAIEAYNLPS